MDSHAQIVSALKGGDSASALVEIDRLLASSPEDAGLLGLRGLALAMSGRIGEAADCVRRAFDRSAEPGQRLKHAGNLARLLANAGRRHELADLQQLDLPRLEGMAEDALDLAALENLCAPLLAAGQHDFVATYLEPVIDLPSLTWPIERLWLHAARAAGRYEALRTRVTAPGYRWREEPEALALGCVAALEEGREAEAGQLHAGYVARAPLHVSPRRDAQLLTIVLISPDPHPAVAAAPAEVQHFSSNFPSQIAVAKAGRYRVLSRFAGSPPRPLMGELRPLEHAVVLNNCVNAEDLKRGQAAAVREHERVYGLPVINPVDAALHCTRAETAERLRGIPGMEVPKVARLRFDPSLTEALSDTLKRLFSWPMILRTVGEQEGRNIHLVASDAELHRVLAIFSALKVKDIYAIQYYGVEHGVGLHRRMRAAYVAGEPLLLRVDYDTHWMVKGRKTERVQARYRSEPSLRERADNLVRNPGDIGEAAWTTLREIGRRMPLDIFGLDFDVDHQGRIVFFEANATMNLLSTAPAEIDYPLEPQDRFLELLDKLLMHRAGVAVQ